MREIKLEQIPSAEEYASAFQAIRNLLSDAHLRILKSQYSADLQQVTSTEIAELAGIEGGHSAVNSQYGRLGHWLSDELQIIPTARKDGTFPWWEMLSSGYSFRDKFLWVMYPQVSKALEELEWVDVVERPAFVEEQQVDYEPPLPSRVVLQTSRVIRNTSLARMIKKIHDNKCQICGETIQLNDGRFYSEAHHIKPLGKPHNGEDVSENILILCPNHHVMCDYGAIQIQASELRMHEDHSIGNVYIEYHNNRIFDQVF